MFESDGRRRRSAVLAALLISVLGPGCAEDPGVGLESEVLILTTPRFEEPSYGGSDTALGLRWQRVTGADGYVLQRSRGEDFNRATTYFVDQPGGVGEPGSTDGSLEVE